MPVKVFACQVTKVKIVNTASNNRSKLVVNPERMGGKSEASVAGELGLVMNDTLRLYPPLVKASSAIFGS